MQYKALDKLFLSICSINKGGIEKKSHNRGTHPTELNLPTVILINRDRMISERYFLAMQFASDIVLTETKT